MADAQMPRRSSMPRGGGVCLSSWRCARGRLFKHGLFPFPDIQIEVLAAKDGDYAAELKVGPSLQRLPALLLPYWLCLPARQFGPFRRWGRAPPRHTGLPSNTNTYMPHRVSTAPQVVTIEPGGFTSRQRAKAKLLVVSLQQRWSRHLGDGG